MLELVNTSLPNGLIAGTHGFATVAMTKGLPDALRRRLESLCAYTHKTSAHDASYYSQNPVNWFHAVLPQGEHVIGRVAASDFDYTGRTNRLARLLIFPGREMPAVGGAAILQSESANLSAPWSGEPRYLPPDKDTGARLAKLQPPTFSSPENWMKLFGSDGAQLAQRFTWQLEKNLKGGGKTIYFKTSATFDQNGTKLLGLFADLIDLLPAELRASVTFSTYPDALPAGTNCLLRGAFDGDRNFAIASSTQPWIDCEHAKVVHPEMLPSEAAPKPKAAVPDKGDAPASLDASVAPQSLDSPNAAQDRKPLRLKQQPSAAPQRSRGSRSPYLPPPRSDDKKFGIIVAACVVAIVALSAGIFVVWQDGEKKKRKAEEQAEMLRQQEAESAQKGAMLENAITNLALVVNQAIGQLEKMKSKIRTTDNPDHFANEELPMERGKVGDARRTASLQGVAGDILASYDARFDKSVAEVDAAIKRRKLELEAARKNEDAQAKAERDKAETESKPKEVVAETITQVPPKPADTRPVFCNAREIKVVGINEIKDHDFIRRNETMKVFFYSDSDRKDFAVEEVSMKKMGTSHIWSPKPEEVIKKSAGLFTIWYSEKEKTAYWLWNLPKNADKGDRWLRTNNHEGEFTPFDLKTEVFGKSTDVYKFYTDHFGNPRYIVSRWGEGTVAVKLENQKEAVEPIISAKLFAPTEKEFEKQKENAQTAVNKAQDDYDREQQRFAGRQNEAKDIIRKVGDLKKYPDIIGQFEKAKSDAETEKAKAKKKEDKENAQKKIDKAETDIKTAKSNKSTLIKGISTALNRLALGLAIIENDFYGKDKETIDAGFEKYKEKLDEILKLKAEDDKGCKTAKEKLDLAKARQKEVEANFEKQWREVAEQSRYAVTAVVGSKETKGKK